MDHAVLPLHCFSAVFGSVAPFINIYFSARIINELAGARNLQRLTLLVILTLALNLIVHLILQAVDKGKAGHVERVSYKEVNTVCEVFLRTDFENLEQPEFQNLKRDYMGARQKGGPLLGNRFLLEVENTIKFFLGIVFSVSLTLSLFLTLGNDPEHPFLTSPILSFLMLVAVLGTALFSLFLTQKKERKNYWLSNNFIRTNRIFGFYCTLMEQYRYGKEIRLYQEGELINEGVIDMSRDSDEFMNQMAHNTARCEGISAVLSALLSGFAYVFVALKALIGVFGIGMVVQYVGAINQFTTNFIGVVGASTVIRQHAYYLDYYFNIIDTKPTKYEGHIPVEKRDDNDYEIEFRNVGFRYPGSSEWALRNLSLKLHIGEKMAVVGRNGSGKTTFIKLLCRLYDPTEGEILLNGIDIRKYDYEEYLSIFSVVFQDFRLFSFPLDQNVATSMELDEERVEECLKKAGFGDRLSSLPDGLSTPLYKDFDENGVEISGGEAQKIALARALYKDAPFIVLDEPTAALDPIAEYEIYSRFDELVGEKTAIYISHRLSSCRFCGDIAVFDHGELVQRGNHEELLAEEGSLYAQLWNAQAQYYTDEVPENSEYLLSL